MYSFVAWRYSRLYGIIFTLLLCIFSLLYILDGSALVFERLGPVRNAFGRSDSRAYHKTALQQDPPPGQPPYGAIVVAARSETDLSWIISPKVNWTVYEYDVDKPSNPDPSLQFPKSKGHEAMVYLSYIINNYEDLPWCAIFIHGHRSGVWHQEDDMIRIISDLNRVALARAGYISLRCDWYPSCPAEMHPVKHDALIWGAEVDTKATEAAIAGNWRQMFPDEQIPDTIASPCCAQFAVTRQAILRRPKADYERLREWLLGSLLSDDHSGRVLEKLWAYIFLREGVHCPQPQQCACEYFGRCEAEELSKPPDGLGSFPE